MTKTDEDAEDHRWQRREKERRRRQVRNLFVFDTLDVSRNLAHAN